MMVLIDRNLHLERTLLLVLRKPNMYDANRHSFEQRLRLGSMRALMSLQTSKLSAVRLA